MTPKEKANKLIEKFMFADIYFTAKQDGAILNAKTCAIIAVEEIIKANPYSHVGNSTIKFWQEVKQQLENEL